MNVKPLKCLAWALAGQALFAAHVIAEPIRVAPEAPMVTQAQRLDWRLDGPFMTKTIEMVITNPHARALEATVLVPLGAHERLQGYALDVQGEFRSAVPVERVKAKVTFETIERAQVDPALAEKQADSSYRIRVFPVPAQQSRKLRLEIASLAQRDRCGWRHTLDGALPEQMPRASSLVSSTLPPKAAVAAPQLAWTRQANGSWQAVLTSTRIPNSLCLPAPQGPIGFSATGPDGESFLWVEQAAKRINHAIPVLGSSRALEVVWDASGSFRGQDRSAELAYLRRWLQGRETVVTLTLLRNDLQRESLTVNATNLDALLQRLAKEPADGATALAQWRPAPGATQVLMFSDGAATWPAGEISRPTVPVTLVAQEIRNAAVAKLLTSNGGQALSLKPGSVVGPAKVGWIQLDQQWAFGPADGAWHTSGSGAEVGAIRACRVSYQPADQAATLPTRWLSPRGVWQARDLTLPKAHASEMARFWCAQWWSDDLEANPSLHQHQLVRIGESLGIANRETSLLVLESVEDYVRYDILPPGAPAYVRAAVMARRAAIQHERTQRYYDHQRRLNTDWDERKKWWNTDFPKDEPRIRWEAERRAQIEAQRRAQVEAERQAQSRAERYTDIPVAPPYVPMLLMPAPAPVAGNFADSTSMRSPQPVVAIRLQAQPLLAPYTQALSAVRTSAQLYQSYLDMRQAYGSSPAFYFDVAGRLYELSDAALANRVISNVVELLPSEPSALRTVAYRLQQARQADVALPLLDQLVHLAPHEPQSFRDLGLALDVSGRCEEALDRLAHVVNTPWDMRFASISVTALAEYNAIGVHCPRYVHTSVPESLRDHLPVDLRVVLRWNLNDTDIDLHVIDPDMQEAYFANRRTYQGALMSRNFRAGYGPEEFVLKNPKPGKYKVLVNYFGSRMPSLTRGATVNIALQRHFGTPQFSEEILSFQLLEHSGKTLVGEFEVTDPGNVNVEGKP